MPINQQHARQYIQAFNIKPLFIEELGWDHCKLKQDVEIDGIVYRLFGIAEKRGLVVFLFQGTNQNELPDYPARRKIEKHIARSVHEHMIIFVDALKTTQVWQWVKREPSKPAACREHRFYRGQNGDALIQKLDPLVITLEEEDSQHLTVSEISSRVRSGFDVDRITKKFYDRFKQEHEVFRDFIQGITEQVALNWYASIMLNRLMFIYFIQKKGFLDNDRDYLRNRLQKVWQEKGKGKFFTFYRYFLLRLFHEGLGQKEEKRNPELEQLLGKVPYLNGGLFDVHELEESYSDINIPDEAFVKLFDFFDAYQWHLDERPLRADNEINPDVLGYIFEKYINQKQMGAYYTKEDITEYIGRNTIVPYLFDAAKKDCKIALEGEQCIWTLLQTHADRYIFPAVGHSLVWDARQTPPKRIDAPIPFPPEIAVGIDTKKPNLLERRKEWNKPAPPEFALPTEIWREVVVRRQRYIEVRERLENGEIRDINDLITYNLDIRQFAQDVIESCEGPELLRAFWKALSEIKILDPTCGSGAFLFTALNILEPLYEAALNSMQLFVEELEHSEEKHSPQKYSDFKQILEELHQHPNEKYFILKKIILNNLYGVDIIDEAVEICKLRLFLKLAAQVESDYSKENLGLEPLPDIDFNIRAGNTLVGFANMDEVKKATEGDLVKQLALPEIEEKAEAVDRLFKLFREQQTKLGGEVTHEDKAALREKLKILDEELNHYLASEYGIDFKNENLYTNWLESHKPFHWFVEFYGIMNQGGFDVIIGNPPYVEYTKIKKEYRIINYQTESCGNLYSYMTERCFHYLISFGRISMIVQLPIVCTDRMKPLQELCLEESENLWFSTYDDRPAKLFDDLEHIRATIFTGEKNQKNIKNVFSTNYNRWYSVYRPVLFTTLQFTEIKEIIMSGAIPKIGFDLAKKIMQKLVKQPPLSKYINKNFNYNTYFHNSPQYWIRAMDFIPYFWNERDGQKLSTQVKTVNLDFEEYVSLFVALMNSTLFYWWFIILSDCRHLNMREVNNFPISIDVLRDSFYRKINNYTVELMNDLKQHSLRKECEYRTTGKVIYDEYYPKYSKEIIDHIDIILSDYYNFTNEEKDFIINYDIKYRMGNAE